MSEKLKQEKDWSDEIRFAFGKNMVYIVDTNVLIDYPDIIPDNDLEWHVDNATIAMDNGMNIVLPTAVIRELSKFKGEQSDRGRVASKVLEHIRELTEEYGSDITIETAYGREQAIMSKDGERTFSIFPLHKDFDACLPFHPSDTDMDGQIILSALASACAINGIPANGTATEEQIRSLDTSQIVILTNDNGLAIRANVRGIKTSRFGYKIPEQYTGRREVTVPRELLDEFILINSVHNGSDNENNILSIDTWNSYMPDEPPFVANEFVIMYPEGDKEYSAYGDKFRNIGRYDADLDAIVPLRYLSRSPIEIRLIGQAIYNEALMNPKINVVICTGPAGCGKTFIPTVVGYTLCNDWRNKYKYIGVTVVPCHVDSDLGALPGELEEKLDPNVQPIKNALRNYLIQTDDTIKNRMGNGKKRKGKKNYEDDEVIDNNSPVIKKLADRVNNIYNNWFCSIPIEHARGRDFAYEFVILDEFQDQNNRQADTLIKRLGNHGKIVITGDIEQVHARYLDRENNGLVFARQLLHNLPMVAQISFTEDEVVRHELVRMITIRQRQRRDYRPELDDEEEV